MITLHDFVDKETRQMEFGTEEYYDAVFNAIYDWFTNYSNYDLTSTKEEDLDNETKASLSNYEFDYSDFVSFANED